ncbi:MAG: hypothetical protein PHS49_07045 [Candidatus Gracilibacteria bacterium]|nr:hypothetical protein [Candidatus Gracilibacteria bacterium]
MNANQIVQLAGVLYFVFGLAFLFNKSYYLKALKDYAESSSLLILSGMIALVLGFVIVTNFNELTMTREGLVTVLGWIGIVKGFSLLLFPKATIGFSNNIYSAKNFDLVIFGVISLGLLLMYLGFLA